RIPGSVPAPPARRSPPLEPAVGARRWSPPLRATETDFPARPFSARAERGFPQTPRQSPAMAGSNGAPTGLQPTGEGSGRSARLLRDVDVHRELLARAQDVVAVDAVPAHEVGHGDAEALRDLVQRVA